MVQDTPHELMHVSTWKQKTDWVLQRIHRDDDMLFLQWRHFDVRSVWEKEFGAP
jgi:hypothetical protein